MKKLLAILISVSLMVSCCVIGSVVNAETINVWDGETITSPKDSNGDGVKEIGTAAEFAWLGANGGTDSYILTNDIYLNNLIVDVSGDNVVPKRFDGTVITDTSSLNIWQGSATFGGTLDGNGYTVSGMFNDIEDDLGSKHAMFATAKDAKVSTIKNLRVINTYFSGATFQAVFFGNAVGSWAYINIDNCYVENAYINSSLLEDQWTHPTVGGLVGYIQGGHLTVNNTGINSIKLNGVGNRNGAFLGDTYSSGDMTITNSYNATAYQTFGGNNSTNNYKGVMTSKYLYSAIANSGIYSPSVKVVSIENMTGKNASVNMWELGDNFYTTEKFPVQKIFIDNINPQINEKLGVEPVVIWGGTTITEPQDSDGDGVKEIGSASEFAWLDANGGSGNYILTSNIYLNDLIVDVSGDDVVLKKSDGTVITDTSTLNIWSGTSKFYGTLDGNGYTVSGMYNPNDAELGTKRAMFGIAQELKGSTIKNLRVSNTYFKGATFQSVFFGTAVNWTTVTIDNCYVENVYLEASSLKDQWTNPSSGVLLGYTQGGNMNVYNTGVSNVKIAGGDTTRYGGFLGDTYASRGFDIKNSYNATKYPTFGGNNSATANYGGTISSEFLYSATANKGACAPAVTVVSAIGMTGKNALVNMWEIGDNFYTTQTFPIQAIFLSKIDEKINKQLGSEPDLISGVGVTINEKNYYKTESKLSSFPKTVEVNVLIAADLADSANSGVVVGNYGTNANGSYNFEIGTYGHPVLRLSYLDGTVVETIFDSVDVRTGNWVNVAIVLDDSEDTAICYVDGIAEQTKTINNFVAYALSSELLVGVDAREMSGSAFTGAIASVNIFDDTRTAEQIANDNIEIDLTDNSLMASYSFEDAYQKNVDDLSSSGNTLLNQGMFYLESVPPLDDYAYSFAIVGDTQFLNHSYTGHYDLLYTWLANNIETYNIKHIFNMGDITNMNSDNEWKRAVVQHAKLDGKVSYSLVRGNHDGYHWDAPDLTKFDQYFGPDSAYAEQYDGAFDETSSVNTYKTLTVGNTEWLILSLDYGFKDNIIDWASKVVEAHPNHKVVVTTHAYLHTDGTTLGEGDPNITSETNGGNNGEDMWNKFIRKYENITFVFSGHVSSSKLVTTQVKGDNGNTVTQMLIDPQALDLTSDGPTGMVALLYFSEDGNTVQVRNFSTAKGKYYGLANQFTVTLENEDVIEGDVNGDGVVNVKDLVAIKLVVVGNDIVYDFKATDINADGIINALDTTELIKILLSK